MSVFWTTPAWLWPLLLVGAAGAVLWSWRAYRQSRPPLSGPWRLVLPSLRGVVLLLLILAVAGPVVSRLSTRLDPPELLILLEDSGSMALADFAGTRSDSAQTRWDQALALVAGVDSALTRINPDIRLRILRGNGLRPLREFALTDPVIPDPENHGTDLGTLLDQAANRMLSRPVKGLLIISDGQETVRDLGRNRGQAASGITAWPQSGPPVVVGVGDPVGAPDRVIKDLRYPDTAYAGDEVVVEFAVVQQGWSPSGPREVRIRLQRLGRTVADSLVTLEGSSQRVELPFRPVGEGLQAYELTVSPLDNERFRQNNRVSLALDLRRSRSRVLLLSARPGWDVRFLAQAAARESRLEMHVAYRGAQGWTLADSLSSFTPPGSGGQWADWDSAILCGWEGLDGWLAWPALAGAVEQGLGLLVLPGSAGSPQGAVQRVPGGLRELLPVDFLQPVWRSGPLFAYPMPEGEDHPVLAGLTADDLADRRGDKAQGDFSHLPPLQGMARVELKPDALQLLSGRPAGANSAAGAPLMVTGNVGRGPVVWFGGRRIWELAFWEPVATGPPAVKDRQPVRQVLQNLLVWISAGQETSGLRFAGHRAVFQEAERVKLSATWRDMRGLAVRDRNLSVILRPLGTGSTEQTFPLTEAPGRSGLFEVELPPLPPGNYQVQLQGEGDPPQMGPVEDLMVTSHSVEQTQVRQDRRNLAQLAAQLEGNLYQAGQAGVVETIVTELVPEQWTGRPRELRHRLDLRAGWPFLIGVVLLLGAEWFIRRRQGLL